MTVVCEQMHAEPPRALKSVRLLNRVLYLNNDPGLSYPLPISQWNLNELIDAIRRACNEYDLVATYQAVRFLAEKLIHQIMKDAHQVKGRFELSWEGERLAYLCYHNLVCQYRKERRYYEP